MKITTEQGESISDSGFVFSCSDISKVSLLPTEPISRKCVYFAFSYKFFKRELITVPVQSIIIRTTNTPNKLERRFWSHRRRYETRLYMKLLKIRIVDQAVIHRLPTIAARVRAKMRSWGIRRGQALGQVFSEYLLFSANQSTIYLSIIWGWWNRPNGGKVPSRLSLTHQNCYLDQDRCQIPDKSVNKFLNKKYLL
jgi:hypothetical protein